MVDMVWLVGGGGGMREGGFHIVDLIGLQCSKTYQLLTNVIDKILINSLKLTTGSSNAG